MKPELRTKFFFVSERGNSSVLWASNFRSLACTVESCEGTSGALELGSACGFQTLCKKQAPN